MNKSVVVRSPKDEILEAIIIDVNKTKWSEIISTEKINTFDEPDKALVQIKFEAAFEGKILKGDDKFTYYENPMSNSKLGKFLERYEDLDVGVKIKVIYDKDGFGKILLD